MIIASTLFLIIGIVTFVVGVVASEDVGLIVVSIGASLLAAVTLAVGVVRDRRRLAAEGLEPSEATMFTEAPTEFAPIVRSEPQPLRPLSEPEPAPLAPVTLTPELDEEQPVRESASVRAARASAAKATAKKPAAKKTAAKKPAAKKTASKKPAAKKTAAKKTAAKKPAAKKPAAKKAAAKKPAARKPATRKPTPPPSPEPDSETFGVAEPTDEG